MPYANRKLEWKIGEPGADETCYKNVRMMDALFDRLTKKCGNPFCNYPLSALRSANFAAPEYGDICATCHDVYSSLTMMNPHLLNVSYFKFHHLEWVQEQKDKERKYKERRRHLGLED